MAKLLIVMICSTLMMLCLGLSLYGVTKVYQPAPYTPIIFSQQAGAFKNNCSREQVKCSTDKDCQTMCKEQAQGQDMACIPVAAPNDRTGQVSGDKVCADRKAVMKCGKQYGGVLTWSGWAAPNRMQWDCLCQFPSYASNDNCTKLNAGICTAYNKTTHSFSSELKWDVSMGRPELGTCTCPTGFVRQTVLANQMPRCVPQKITGLYTDLSTSDGYSYTGCYTLPASLVNQAQTVTGIKDARAKAGTAAFFAISKDKMVTLTAGFAGTLSKHAMCQRVCGDDGDFKCADADYSGTRHWAVYKKN
jgi:hypothetical protein